VAGIVLRNPGLELRAVNDEALRVRKQQMRIVERAVRPLPTGIAHRRKMREELLAHLTAIYDEELTRLHDPDAALREAVTRFGNPAELARELQDSIPASQRPAWFFERWLGWRAPEPVWRMMLRTSFVSFCFIAVLTGIPLLAGIVLQGWNPRQAVGLRVWGAMSILTPLAQFGLGVCHYRMRDSL